MAIQEKIVIRETVDFLRKKLRDKVGNVRRLVVSKTASKHRAPGCRLEYNPDELRAFYDLAVCPATFDIANFLALAEIARLEHGRKYLRIFVVPAPGHGFRDLSVHSVDHSRHRVMNIIAPALQTLRSCSGISLLSDRVSAEHLVPERGEPVFPYGYTLDRPTWFYTWKHTWKKVHENKDVQTLRAPETSFTQVNQWLKNRNLDRKRVAVITLREANYQKERNNDIREWVKFCSYLSSKGYQPLILRDFEKSYKKLPDGLQKYPTCDIANWDLAFRVGLYESATIAFFVNNGPWVFGLFNKNVDFIATKVITESVLVTSTSFRIDMGDTVGENYSFLRNKQQVVWENDSFSTLVRKFELHQTQGLI